MDRIDQPGAELQEKKLPWTGLQDDQRRAYQECQSLGSGGRRSGPRRCRTRQGR